MSGAALSDADISEILLAHMPLKDPYLFARAVIAADRRLTAEQPAAYTDPLYFRIKQKGGSFTARYEADELFTFPLYARAPVTAEQGGADEAGAKFLLVAMDDDRCGNPFFCEDEAAVSKALLPLMFFLQEGETLDADHTEQFKGNLESLLEDGFLQFEGDPSIYLYRLHPRAALTTEPPLNPDHLSAGQFSHGELAALKARPTAKPARDAELCKCVGQEECNGACYGQAAQPQAEPALWQWRFYDETNERGWTAWEEVKPRNQYTDTVADKVRELRAYIADGYKYELRALYATPPTESTL